MKYQFYDVLKKEMVGFEEWYTYQKAHNKNRVVASQLPYYDALTHPDKTLLPSSHPWWKYQYYLGIKWQFIRSHQTIISYQNTLGPDLNAKVAGQIRAVLRAEIDQKKVWETKYRELQKELNHNLPQPVNEGSQWKH